MTSATAARRLGGDRALLFGLALVLAGAGGELGAASLPPGFSETLIATGLNDPTAMAFAPDGRLFVCEQGGALRVVKNGALLAAPFVTLSVASAGERGLLGVAFDPSFASNQYLYVYYTTSSAPIHNRISRFTASGDVAAPGSETVILDLDNLSSATNHNGGAIHFGPDGKLYAGVGENATASNSQTLANLLGKMLRLNADGSIPADNPFYAQASGRNRAIWAIGLRNPFTFAFQSGSGRMFINDVGASTWEEIDDGVAGANYGWPVTEGPTSNPQFRGPLFAYGHGTSGSTGCAITGAAFYNPGQPTFPAAYVGSYFFADLCSGWIRRLEPGTASVADFASGIQNPVDLAVSDDGDLYYLTHGSGQLYRVRYAAGAAVRVSVEDRAVAEGGATNAAFRVLLSGPSDRTITMSYATIDDTAVAGADYLSTSGVLSFTPGRTVHSVWVPIVTDGISEGDESFFLRLGDLSPGAVFERAQATATIANPPASQHVPMYRCYNKSTDYHFFTIDLASKDFAVGTLGFQDESNPIPFYVWNSQQSGSVPLYRIYNPNLGRHFYTASSGSRDFLMGIGAVYERDEGFVYPLSTSPAPAGTTELYLLYNNNSGTHLFAADVNQKDGILSLFPGVWVQHTSVGFVFTNP